jgi:hypothetical protein
MLSAFTLDAMSGHPFPASATVLVGSQTYTVLVSYHPDTEQRCARAALVLLNWRPLEGCARSATQTPGT